MRRPIPLGCQGYTSQPGEAKLVRRYPNLSFERPVQLLHHPSGPWWYVVEQGGTVRRFADRNDASTSELVADLTSLVRAESWEDGLLGIAFPPNFTASNEVVVKYTTHNDASELVLALDRMATSDDGASFDVSARTRLLTIDRAEGIHHGGPPGFGRDGLLYVPVGNGIALPDGRAQDPSRLEGKILRIDLAEAPYRIPDDNPFVGVSGTRPEIWAMGFRNPWGWAFDPKESYLWVGDVGGVNEEVNRVVAGGNYGWPFREGGQCNGMGPCDASFVDAVYEYPNGGGAAIVGGPVYDGQQFPAARGKVTYGDFILGRIAYVDDRDGVPVGKTLLDTGMNPTFLTLDTDGELLFGTYLGGLYSLEYQTPGASPPTLLSATGCVDVTQPRQAPEGMLPYDVNMPLWSDGTEKSRWIALPADQNISVKEGGQLELPIGTVLVKNFFWRDRPVETRLLVRHEGGEWGGYSYEWREDATDAVLLESAKHRELEGFYWQYPSRVMCRECHTEAAGRTLGLSVAQLNRPMDYGRGRVENQFSMMQRMGVFDRELGEPGALPRFPARDDDAAPAEEWSRAYLHANCAHCHRPGGPGRGIDLRFSASLRDMGCDRAPDVPLNLEDERLLAPSRPDSSVVLERIASNADGVRMPYLARYTVDELAVSRIREWISATPACVDAL